MSFVQYPTDPLPIFPHLPVEAFPVTKRPTFAGWEHRSVTGKQYQTARQAYPNWEFDLQYTDDSWLRERTQNISLYAPNSPHVEFEALSQLFLSCFGNYGEFWYDDPEDDSRFDQPIATADGVTFSYRIMRTWGLVGSLARLEPVGGVDLSRPIVVYLDAVPVSVSNYTVSNATGGSFLTFKFVPTAGQAITMDLYFYYRCRWVEDGQQYDQWAYNLFNLGKARFRSVKP